jgi:hypothetical protein
MQVIVEKGHELKENHHNSLLKKYFTLKVVFYKLKLL